VLVLHSFAFESTSGVFTRSRCIASRSSFQPAMTRVGTVQWLFLPLPLHMAYPPRGWRVEHARP